MLEVDGGVVVLVAFVDGDHEVGLGRVHVAQHHRALVLDEPDELAHRLVDLGAHLSTLLLDVEARYGRQVVHQVHFALDHAVVGVQTVAQLGQRTVVVDHG